MKFQVIVSMIVKTIHVVDADSFPEAEQAGLEENAKSQGVALGKEVTVTSKSIQKVKTAST